MSAVGLLLNPWGTITRRNITPRVIRDIAQAHSVDAVQIDGSRLRVTFSNGNVANTTGTPEELKSFHKGTKGFPDATRAAPL